MQILIAVDGSEQASEVISGVAPWVPADAQVTIVSVIDGSEMRGVLAAAPEPMRLQWSPVPPHEPIRDGSPTPRVVEYQSQAVDYAESDARDALQRLARQLPDNLNPSVRVEIGDAPADSILAVAEELDADTIVVGTHGRGGVRRALMGSVAETVIRNSQRPVLVVPVGRT